MRRRRSGRVRARGHPGEQRRRRPRPGRPPARGDRAGGVAGDLRRQRHRRVLLFPGRRAGNEGGAQRTDRQHLERGRARHQPHGNSSLRVGEGGANRLDPAACPRTRAVGHHGQQHRARLRAVEPDNGEAVGRVRRRRAARARRSDRTQAARYARRHRVRRAVLCLRLRRLDHWPGARDRRRKMIATDSVLAHLRRNRERIFAKLVEFASIPSVSTDPAHAADIDRAAAWVAAELAAAGPIAVRTLATAGNPVVYGEWLGAPGRPTVLVYGHYDVQPPDPLEKWQTPPWTLTLRDGRVYARGVSDDKAPMLMPIAVAEAFFTTAGRLPINVKFMFEVEDEIGSRHLEAVVQQHAGLLGADVVVSADGAMWRIDEPSLTVA